MDDTTILGGALNQLGQAAKQAGKQIVKIPGEMTEDFGEQIAGAKPDASQQNQSSGGWQSDEERIRFLKDLYGKSDMSKDGEKPEAPQNPANVQSQKPSEFQQQIAKESPEDQKKLVELRNQLFKENYYDPTFNPVKKQEERPAEKVENEKKKEMMDLQEKEDKKPQPIAVVREQNKAEQFRGAAG